MKLKGEMVIELTDTNTGAVETVQETNMITEAVNNILGLNPMGIYLKASGEYDNSVLWNGTLLPICPNMIGGILLFPAVLEEKADHIYEQGKNLPVAYASNNVNSGSNVARGSLNQTESKKLDNGYKFVWEFTPSQGNGNIAAVALTSALGGQNAFGSAAGDASTFLLLKKVDIGDIPKARQMTLFEAVELDFERNLLYSITFGTSSVTITKIRIPVFNIGLNEKLDDTTYTVLEEQTLTTESFTFLGDYTKYGEFMDGHDGYWYGFSNEPNSSRDAKMVWIRIYKKDYSFTEGSWTLSKAQRRRVDLSRLAEKLDADIAELEQKFKAAETMKDDSLSQALSVMKKHSGVDELTQTMVQELIEKVVVKEPEHVEIVWKFKDEVRNFIEI